MLAAKLAQQVLRAGELVVEDPAGDVEQVADQRVADGVTDADAGLGSDDDLAGAEDRELLRHHRLLEPELFLQLLHGAVALDQDLEDADPDRVGEGLEEAGLEGLERADRGGRRHVVLLYIQILIYIYKVSAGAAPAAAVVMLPLPKLVRCLRAGYSPADFAGDLLAGVTVGLVALPLAMAFAIASGLPPQNGIYCAIVAGFTISALGGSRVQIGGPTGAFVVVVSGIVAAHGLDGLFMCTLLAGIILILLGITGLGSAVKYIPRPVVIGFTNGIGVLIASTQLRDLFGLSTPAVPGEFIGRDPRPARQRADVVAGGDGAGSGDGCRDPVAAPFLPPHSRQHHRAARGGGLRLRIGLPVETVGSRFGGVPSGLPALHVPTLRLDLVLPLLSPALTVAMLGAIESLLSAVVADRMSGDRHDPNVELTAQGVANVLSPLFGGLPATGAIARTAANVRAGARTPIAGMTHAVTLLLVLLFAAPLASHIPMAMLAGILLIVAFDMGEWREIPG